MLHIITLGLSLVAQSADSPRNYDPNLVVFAGELRNYVEGALELKASSETDTEFRNKKIAELSEIGRRISRIYFKQNESVIQNELHRHLQTSLKENKDSTPYFVFLGNAFADEAARILRIYHAKQKQMKLYITAGGAGLGLLIGGGIVFFKLRSASELAQATTSNAGKNLLIVAGAIATGAAIGFGAGSIYAGKLPMDTTIKNASDFAARYPHGEDFIKNLEGSGDLRALWEGLQR